MVLHLKPIDFLLKTDFFLSRFGLLEVIIRSGGIIRSGKSPA